jgi:hypothetical protein
MRLLEEAYDGPEVTNNRRHGPLHRMLSRNLGKFLTAYEWRFEKEYGHFRLTVKVKTSYILSAHRLAEFPGFIRVSKRPFAHPANSASYKRVHNTSCLFINFLISLKFC